MPNPNPVPPSLERRPRGLWLTPLPHPSWSGEARAAAPARPLAASEFWQRLGL